MFEITGRQGMKDHVAIQMGARFVARHDRADALFGAVCQGRQTELGIPH